MYPHNPNLLEKLAWTKVDEIQNEVKNANKYSIQPRPKVKVFVTTGILIALAWMFSVLL